MSEINNNHGRKINFDLTISLTELIRIAGLIISIIYLSDHFASRLIQSIQHDIAQREKTAEVIHKSIEQRVNSLEDLSAKISTDISQIQQSIATINGRIQILQVR